MTSKSPNAVAMDLNGRPVSAGPAASADTTRDIAEAFSGRFEIIELLGQSDEVRCYLAGDLGGPGTDAASGLVRLKVLSDAAARNPELLSLFRLEARAASSLLHPNILNAGSDEQMGLYHFCVIEHSPGAKTLRSLLDRKGWLDAPLASGIAMQVARALEEAHKEGVLHLKLSPESILITPDGVVRLADFGLEVNTMKSANGDLKRAHDRRSNLCPARYASPEQASGAPVDHRSDLYSLGVVLFEALTDRVPFNGESPERIRLKHRTQPPLPPHVYCESVPRALSSVVMRLLEKNPRDRFESASELCGALAEFVPAVAPSPAPETLSPATTPREDRALAPAVSSEAPGRAAIPKPFNTFDLDFDIEPLGSLLPEAGLQKNEDEHPRQFEEIEPAREWNDSGEEEAEAVARVREPEDITINSPAHSKTDEQESRERRQSANNQRIAEKIKAASTIEASATQAPLIEAMAVEPVPVKSNPELQPSITSKEIGLPSDRNKPHAAAIANEPSARKLHSQPEPSGSTGGRGLRWFALAVVVALCLAAITFAGRFPKLLFGGEADIPSEQGRESGTFVPTPASAMPESVTTRKAGGGEAGSTASEKAGASSAKPAAQPSAKPPIKNAAPPAKPPAAVRKPAPRAKPVARKSQAKSRKSSARQRTSRRGSLPVYNPRYN